MRKRLLSSAKRGLALSIVIALVISGISLATFGKQGRTPQAIGLVANTSRHLAPISDLKARSGGNGGQVSVPSFLARSLTIRTWGYPFGEAYDPENGRLFVADFAANVNNITVIDTIENRVVSTIHLPQEGIEYPLFDGYDGLVYVGNCCSQIYAIDANTSQLVATLNLGIGCSPGCAPQVEAFDPSNRDVYVVDVFTNNVTVFTGTGPQNPFVYVATAPVGQCANGLGYDSTNGNLYASNECQGNLSIINGTTNRPAGSVASVQAGPGVVADPATGDVFVAGNNVSGQANVTVVSGVTNKVVATVATANASGWAAYDPLNGGIYVTERFNSTQDVQGVKEVSGTPEGVVATLSTQQGPIGIAYDDFNHEMYVADSDTNNVSLLFPLRAISFVETGLPNGTNWSVGLNNMSLSSNTSVVPFTGADGPYQYAVPSIRNYTVTPQSGTFVMNGTNVTVEITFAPVTFPATFHETGLPNGTEWSVTVSGSSRTSTVQALTFALKNGTYNFTVNSPPGYTVVPANGSFTIAGTNRTFDLAFKAVPPKPTWTLLGLTAEDWVVTLVVVVLIAVLASVVWFRRRKVMQLPAASSAAPSASTGDHRPP